MKTVSVVIPVCNEEGNLAPLYGQLCQMSETLPGSFQLEIVFVDDFSTDGSRNILENLAQKDKRIKVVCLARNFGSHAAIKAGFRYATGEYIAFISADLQDHPEIVSHFLKKALEGYDIVWGQRESRDDPASKILFAKLFFKLVNKVSVIKYPESGMDVFLISKRIKEVVLNMKESNTFLHFQILWLGYRQAYVPYHRGPRIAGETKFSLKRRMDGAISALISFSYFPLRLISYIGLLIFFGSLLYSMVLIFNYFLGHPASGFTALMLVNIFLFGVMFLCLGILAEYLWLALWQVMDRPEFLVSQVIQKKVKRKKNKGRQDKD